MEAHSLDLAWTASALLAAHLLGLARFPASLRPLVARCLGHKSLSQKARVLKRQIHGHKKSAPGIVTYRTSQGRILYAESGEEVTDS